MRRVWWFAGVTLLVTGVLFEERHRARTIDAHLHPAALADPDPAGMAEVFNRQSNFSDFADLWGDPWAKPAAEDASYASLVSAREPGPAGFERFRPRAEGKTDPVITMENRRVGYNVLQAGGFKLNLNLIPGYPTPEALLPTRVDPGISGSFSF